MFETICWRLTRLFEIRKFVLLFHLFNNFSLKSRWKVAKYLPSRESGEGNIPKATIHRVEKNNCFCKQFIHRPQINSVTVNGKTPFWILQNLFLPKKKSILGKCRILKDRSLKEGKKKSSSHIIHSLGGEYCWIVRDSKITECVYTNPHYSFYLSLA